MSGSSFYFSPAATADPFTPTGTIAASTVQAAIAEAALEALQKSGDTATGTMTMSAMVVGNTMSIADNTNIVLSTNTGTLIGTTASQKLGFLGATPVVQAARAGQIVDSSGGTTGTNTIAAITGAVDPTAALKTVTANAIATLAARLNAVETIIHNSGLSA